MPVNHKASVFGFVNVLDDIVDLSLRQAGEHWLSHHAKGVKQSDA